jgi:hypothetical protein
MAILFISHVEAGCSPGINTATTTGIDTTEANLLVVQASSYSVRAIPTITDSKGNNWIQLNSYKGAVCMSTLFYCVNPTVGSNHTFTITITGGYPSLAVAAFSGVEQLNPIDQQNGTAYSNVTSGSSGSITPSTDNQLVLTGLNVQSTSISSVSAPFSITGILNWNSNQFGSSIGYEIQTSKIARNPTWTLGGTGNTTIQIVSFFEVSITTQTVTYTSKARIKIQSIKTVNTKAQIKVNKIITLNTKGRITQTSIHIFNTKGRIQSEKTKTINSKADIKITSFKTIQSKGRTSLITLKTLTVKARVSQGRIYTISVKSRIQFSQSKTLTSKGRIGFQTTRSLTSKAQIQNQISKTINVKARIEGETETGIILIWAGTNASIPDGWERVTSLDGKFLKGTADGVDPNVTGGSDSHSHTSPSHTHTMISHNHTGYTDGAHNSDNSQCDNTSASSMTRDNHTHTFNISGVSGGSLVDAISYQSVTSLPPYYEVIYITPTTTTTDIVSGIIGFWQTSSTPDGWTFCNGENSTPDLRNKHLRGAGAGGNSGATGGGTTHSHTIDHTHTGVSHSHSGTSDSANATANSNDSTTRPSNYQHTHSISLPSSGAETGSAYTGSAGSADTVEIAYKKLIPIQSDGTPATAGFVGMWLGLLEDIPSGWMLCDGSNGTLDMRGQYAKCADATANVGNTGGSNTHSHSASNSHTHTAAGSHSHSTGGSTNTVNSNGPGSYGDYGLSRNHYHLIASVSSNTSSWNDATVASDESNNEPAYRTVAFIQYSFITATKTATAKASIFKNEINTITSKANIRTTFPVTINAKSDIKSIVSRTINAKGVVGIVFHVQAKGDIKKFGVSRIIQVKGALQLLQEYSLISKANIRSVVPQTIQSIGNIYKEGTIIEPSFGGITLPFPSEATIEPIYEIAENTTLKGETRRKVMARKYKYTLGWDTMFVTNYDALEAIVNILGDAIFIYQKWPQSITGIDCIASLSSRKLEYGTGNSTYVSSVILTLTEVDSRI